MKIKIKIKIIFSQEGYLKLLTLIKKTRNLGSETGCVFVGRQIVDNIKLYKMDNIINLKL